MANTETNDRRESGALRHEEGARLRALFDNALDAILIAAADGCYVDVNPAACALLGYTRAELLRLSVWDLTQADHRDQAEARWREFDAVGQQSGECSLRRKDGATVEVEYRAVADFIPGLHLSILRDITASKVAEAALQISEAQYRAVAETSLDGFWIIDQTGRLLEANEAYARLSGYSRSELRGMRVADLEADRGPAAIAAKIEEIAGENGVLFQTRHRTKSGRVWHAEVNATRIPAAGGRFFAFIRDIDLRQRSDALLKARLRLSDIAHTGSLDSLLRAALDAAEQLTGSRLGFFHFVDPDQAHLILQARSTNTPKNPCEAGEGSRYPVDRAGAWGECIHRRAPVIHDDSASSSGCERAPGRSAALARELAIPILRGDAVVAVVGVANKPGEYTDGDVAAVRELASMTMDLVERKQIEQTLRHYERIVAATPDSVALLDRHYVYLAVNDEYLRRTGRPRDMIVGRTVGDIMGEESFRARLKDKLDRCLAGELIQYRDWFDFAAAGRRLIDVSYAPYRDETGAVAGVVINARDSTNLKKAEETAQIALVKYKTLFDTFPTAIAITDEAGNILETNAMAEHLLGVAQAEQQLRSIHGAEWQTLRADGTPMPPAEYPAVRALKENCLIENVQMGVVKPSNETTWISVTASPLPLDGYGVVAAYSDVTERKKAQEALQKSEEFKQATLDSVAAHIAVLDRDGEIVAVNAPWQRFALDNPIRAVGPARNCAIGANYLEICRRSFGPSAEGAMTVHDGIRAVLGGRLANFRFEYPCHAPREQRWFSMMVTPLGRGGGGAVVAHSNITDLKRAESALQRAQERLALAIDGAELGLYNANLQTGQVEANERYLEMEGLAPGATAITRQSWLDAIHPDDRPRVLQISEEHLAGRRERFEAEYRVRHRSGRWIWVLDRGKGFDRDGSGQPRRAAGTRIDITERKQVEEWLRKSEEHMRLAMGAALMGTWEWNIESGEIFWSDNLWAMFGLEGGSRPMTFDRFRDLVHPEDRDRLLQAIEGAVHRVAHYHLEARFARPDGSFRWASTHGRVLGDAADRTRRMVGVDVDITERKRIEAELRESEQRFRALVNLLPYGVQESDTEGRITFANPALERLHGPREGGVVGRFIWDFVADATDRERLRDHLQFLVREQPPPATYFTKDRCADGSVIDVQIDWSYNRDQCGRVQGFIAVIADITERKRAETRLAESAEHLQQLSRRLLSVQEEERRALARELHDDFGQQLAALKLNLAMLERELRDPAHRSRLADCIRIVEHARESIQAIARQLRPAILDDLGLSEALHWYARGQAERTGCAIEVEDRLPALLSPNVETAVFRIVQEAVNNAIRHGQARRIDIAVGVDQRDLTLVIRDDGAGFDPDAPAAENRSGLGLIGMRERAALLGGRFALAGRPGAGVRIEVAIPLVEESP